MKKETVYIGIGSNLGDREKNIKAAIDLLKDTPGLVVEKVSSLIETEPQGYMPQGKFLNGVVKIRTELSASKLFSLLQGIESKLRRVKTVKNGPRTIDLDILLYADHQISTQDLVIPHPRMFQRRFVILPLLEIEPDILDRHPLLKEYKDQVKNLILQ
jgi:2-amino-4-hydroxy-6-hydroxymethyldihydropteridine diphosphokinase